MNTPQVQAEEAQLRIDKALAKLRENIEHHTKDPTKRIHYFTLFEKIYVFLSEGSHTLDEFNLKRTTLQGSELPAAVNEFTGHIAHYLSNAIDTIEAHFWNEEKTDET